MTLKEVLNRCSIGDSWYLVHEFRSRGVFLKLAVDADEYCAVFVCPLKPDSIKCNASGSTGAEAIFGAAMLWVEENPDADAVLTPQESAEQPKPDAD